MRWRRCRTPWWSAVPDKVRGQAVAAYVVAKDPSLTIAELTRFCNNSPMLSTYKRPRWYCIVEELPHTGHRKEDALCNEAAGGRRSEKRSVEEKIIEKCNIKNRVG